MDVNGSVSLTLSELDKIRKNVSEKDDKLKEKDTRINKLAVEIVAMKAAEPRVTVTINQIIPFVEMQRVSESYRSPYDDYLSYNPSYIKVPPVPKYKEVVKGHLATSIEYLNLEDIKVDLKRDIEQRYGDELIALKNKVTSLTKERVDYEAVNYQEKLKLQSNYKSEFRKLGEQFTSKTTELENVIKVLRDEEVTKTKDQLILDLKAEIEKLKNQSFIKRLFNG
jgi:hypothetical protein